MTADYYIELTWEPSIDNGEVSQYIVYGSLGLFQITEEPFLLDTEVICTEAKCYQIVAVDTAGNWSAYSERMCCQPYSCADQTPPAPPTVFYCSPHLDEGYVEFLWNASTSDDVVGYRIYDVLGLLLEIDGNSGGVTYWETEIPCDLILQYYITAVDWVGNESYPRFTTCTTPPCGD
jgi:hypothetical protein